MKKKFLSIALTLAMASSLIPSTVFASELVWATYNNATVVVDGVETAFESYTIEDNNYFKLRDLATILGGTEKEIEVAWDGDLNAINLISGTPYTPEGGEMEPGDGMGKDATLSTSEVYLDGNPIGLMAYTINQNNYFKLCDLFEVLDVYVGWDQAAFAIELDTTRSYGEETPTETEVETETETTTQTTPSTDLSVYQPNGTVAVYATEDVVVFQYSHDMLASITDWENGVETEADRINLEMRVGLFGMSSLTFRYDEGIHVSTTWRDMSQPTSAGYAQYNEVLGNMGQIRYAVEGNTLRIAYLSHGYDISQFENAIMFVHAVEGSDNDILTNVSGSSLAGNYPIYNTIPDGLGDLWTVESPWTEADFGVGAALSMVTDDYVMYTDDTDGVYVYYFGEDGYVIAWDRISIVEGEINEDALFWNQEVRDGNKIVTPAEMNRDQYYTKMTYFGRFVNMNEYTTIEMMYFSQPTLEYAQVN